MIICSFITGSINDQGRIVALADGDLDIGDVDFYAVLLVPVTDCPNPLCGNSRDRHDI